MDSVYDCARPFMLLGGIVGMGGSVIREIDGVRSVQNTRFSLIIAVLVALVITPAFFIDAFFELFSGEERSLISSTSRIIFLGQYGFIISTTAVTCIRTHIYCKNLTKVLQILNNTDMMLKQENIHVNYRKITLKTVLFGVISCNYLDIMISVYFLSWNISSNFNGRFIVKLFMDIVGGNYFVWLMLFLLIIRERFVGVNKLLLQNAQVPSIVQDDSLLRRISLARDIHEQLSEAIELFSDLSRFLIVGVLVPGLLNSLFKAIGAVYKWDVMIMEVEGDNMMLLKLVLKYSYGITVPIIKILILTTVCEGHKNNRLVLTARLRYLISREEDPRTVQQLKQYIWFIYDTPAGLVDVQLVDVDSTLSFTVIDIFVQYLFVVYSYVRVSVQGETM